LPERKLEHVLVCRIGTLMCALPVEHVSETMRPLPVERLAGAPPFVLGVSVVRGSPVPVLDGAALLGVSEAPPPGRFVSIKVGVRRAALAVSAVIGTRALLHSSFGELPPLVREAAAGVVASIGRLDADLLLMLRSARIVPESVWAALDAKELRQ